MQEIIEFFGWLFDDAQKMSVAISTLAAFLVAYRGIYRLVGIFFTRKFSPAKNQHKYG